METFSRITSNVRLLVIVVGIALMGLVLTISLFVAFEIVAAVVALFITLGLSTVLLLVGINNAKLNDVRRDLRRLEKKLDATAAPQQSQSTEALQQLNSAMEERRRFEGQVLRQIVAEARLIRMYAERAEGDDANR